MSEFKPIGVWKFTKSSIEGMERLNEKTKKIGIEYGSLICADWKTLKIDLSGECTGTECKILAMKEKCPKDVSKIGEFHTHPKTKVALPSQPDLIRMEQLGLIATCIGTPNAKKDEQILCFRHKYIALEPERVKARKKELEIPKISKGKISTLILKDYDTFNPKEVME